MISIKSSREIQVMRKSCTLAADTLAYIEQFVQPGVSTLELNDLCHNFIIEHGAIPSPLNYNGFPKSICTSINEVVCHGIPCKEDILKDGDIINVDITTFLNGFHGDVSKTFCIGNISKMAKKLVNVAYESMLLGINEVRPEARLGNVGAVIADYAHKNKFSVVIEYCGHGIGHNFHESPQVIHDDKKNTGVVLKPGMTFTIEPMINVGTYKCEVLDDKWTVVTADGKLSAQFEHTILVTETGYEILTLPSA